MCHQAKYAAVSSIKLAIVLLVCQAMLLYGPAGYDTYYNLQVIRAMPEVIFSVLLAGGLGSAWLQSLHKRADS